MDTKTTLTWLLKDQVSPTAAKINGELGKLQDKAGGSHGALGKLGGALGGLLTPTNLAIGGIGALVGGLGEAMKMAADEQINIARMGTALKASVPGWDGNTDAIERLITKREDLAFSDDELRASFATLVTSTHDVGQATDLQAIAMDLARLKGVDLETATNALAKANAGSTKELKALGITVDDSKDKTQVFAAIQKAAAGQAEAYAKTTTGRWEQMQVKIGDLAEDVGSTLLPIMDALLSFAVDDLIPALREIANVIGPVIIGAINFVAPKVRWLMDNIIGPAINAIKGLLGWIHDALKSLGLLSDTTANVSYDLSTVNTVGGGGGKAAGGPVEPGMAYTVGESGPETLVMGSQGGTIVPNGVAGTVAGVVIQGVSEREILDMVDRGLYFRLRGAAPTLLRT